MNNQKIFVTSDTHWFHTNIIKYSNRPWADTDQMGEALIKNWNSVVGKGDIVYHLGDVAMGGKKRADELSSILSRLNGTIRLIKGNHDNYVLKSPCVDRFEWVKDYYELKYTSPSHGKRKFILQHYPLYTWNNAGRTGKDGSCLTICLHGHCHGSIDRINNLTTRMDVGVDSNGYIPVLIDNIIEVMNYRKYNPVDHHNSKTTY